MMRRVGGHFKSSYKCSIFQLVAIFIVMQTACLAGEQPMNVNKYQSLKACPTSPNCVSSQAVPSDKEHYIEPLRGLESPALSQQQLLVLLSSMAGCQVVEQEGSYLHVTFTSRWLRFVDDVEFLVGAEQIHMRSASRIGYSDFGANRKRLEQLHQLWSDAAA